MNFETLTKHRVVRLLKATMDGFLEDCVLRLSAALAYYSIFSIAPLLVIAIGVAGLVLDEKAVRGELGEQLTLYIGAKAAESVQSMVQSAARPADSWLGATVGFATLLVGASGVFGQLKDALNSIWEVKASSGMGIAGFIKERLLSFGMVLVIGFLLLTSLMLTTALASVTKFFGDAAGLSPVLGAIVSFAVSFGVETLLFALILKVLPDVKIEWRHVWFGAAVTALLFEAGKFGLGYYLGRESTASSFGAAGSVVLLLLWVYYASCILLLGAEFTQVYAKDCGHEAVPVLGAESMTEEKRAQEGMGPAKPAPEPMVAAAVRPPAPSAEPDDEGPHPAALFFGVMAVFYVIGIVAQRRPVQARPVQRLRQDFSDLGEQTLEALARKLQHARR